MKETVRQQDPLQLFILCNALKYHLLELICYMNIMIKSTDLDRIYL